MMKAVLALLLLVTVVSGQSHMFNIMGTVYETKQVYPIMERSFHINPGMKFMYTIGYPKSSGYVVLMKIERKLISELEKMEYKCGANDKPMWNITLPQDSQSCWEEGDMMKCKGHFSFHTAMHDEFYFMLVNCLDQGAYGVYYDIRDDSVLTAGSSSKSVVSAISLSLAALLSVSL